MVLNASPKELAAQSASMKHAVLQGFQEKILGVLSPHLVTDF